MDSEKERLDIEDEAVDSNEERLDID